jgi:hypothetical protein
MTTTTRRKRTTYPTLKWNPEDIEDAIALIDGVRTLLGRDEH